MLFEGLKSINQAKYGGNSEAWGIVLSSYDLPDSEGNIIEECEVSQFVRGGGSISAISMGGCSGIIRNNCVILPQDNPGCAFDITSAHDVLIEDNYADGGDVACYSDSGGCTNILVAHNTFRNCGCAVSLHNSSWQNLTFAFNNIVFTNGDKLNPNGAFDFSCPTDPSGTFNNIIILGNTSWDSWQPWTK